MISKLNSVCNLNSPLLCSITQSLALGVRAWTSLGGHYLLWVPICRIVSLLFVVGAGKVWGLVGILAVPVAVQLLLMHVWKPYYLYRDGFKESFVKYVKLLCANALPFLLAFFATKWVISFWGVSDGLTTTWSAFLVKSLSFCAVLLFLSALFSYAMSEGIRSFVQRVKESIHHKKQ